LKTNKSTLLKYIFIVVALIVMALLIDVHQFIELMKQISIPFFFVVILVVIFDQAFMGAKWNFLLHVFKVDVPYWVPILAYLRGRIFMFVAPSSLGLDAYKLYCVRKYHKKSSPIISSIVIERSFGILSSLAIVLLLLPFSIHIFDFAYKDYIVLISITGFISLCLVLHFIQSRADLALKLRLPRFLPEKIHSLLDAFVTNIAKLKHGRRQVWIYFFLSIAEKTSYGLAIYFSARAIGLSEPGLLLIISIAPVVALLERLPVSVSAIGIREGLFVILFAPFYDDITIPITISLVLRAAEMIQMLVFLLSWFIGRKPQAIEEELHQVETEYENYNKLSSQSPGADEDNISPK